MKAVINLMQKKGFVFLGINEIKNNAFFVKNDFSDLFNLENDLSLSFCTNTNIRESKDQQDQLTYLPINQTKNLIKDCEVFDFGRSGYLSGTYEFKRKWGAAPVPIVERTETRLRYAKVNYGLSQAVSKGWRLLPKPLTSRLGPVVFPAVAL